MRFFKEFTFLMKDEPGLTKKGPWVLDENKCLCKNEVRILRKYCRALKIAGIRKEKFTLVRNWFMVELGLNTGLRVAEMAGLKHLNIQLEESRPKIPLIGKGGKERSVWIGEGFKKMCLAYIGYKKRFGYDTNPDAYLLNNLKGEKISKRALQKFFKQIVYRSGLPRRYHIHCLRHTYATFLLRASNNNYKLVQKMLGHASIRTTQTYLSVFEAEGRVALEKLFQ